MVRPGWVAHYDRKGVRVFLSLDQASRGHRTRSRKPPLISRGVWVRGARPFVADPRPASRLSRKDFSFAAHVPSLSCTLLLKGKSDEDVNEWVRGSRRPHRSPRWGADRCLLSVHRPGTRWTDAGAAAIATRGSDCYCAPVPHALAPPLTLVCG